MVHDRLTSEDLHAVLARSVKLFDSKDIEAAIGDIAEQIKQRLGSEEVIVLCVMQGGLMLTGKLMPMLPPEFIFDYIHATRYTNNEGGTTLNWLVYPKTDLNNRLVLILDDILDEGYTLQAIVDYCKSQGARQVLTAVLLQKKHDRLAPGAGSDFIALQVDDQYVYGYGMDYKGRMRNLDCIYAVGGEE